MMDEDCATFLDALDAVVAGKDLPKEALEAIRRGARALRVKGMLVEALRNYRGTHDIARLVTHQGKACDCWDCAQAEKALAEARKEPT